jgi:hypothetical protein
LELLLRQGQFAPLVSGGKRVGNINERAIDEQGRVLVAIELDDFPPGGPSFGPHAIYRFDGGTPELLFTTGDVAPGTNGATFDTLTNIFDGSITPNSVGDFLIEGMLALGDAGVTEEDRQGIWIASDSGTRLLARTGLPIGDESNGAFADFSSPMLNDAGDVAFIGVSVDDDDVFRNRTIVFFDVSEDSFLEIVRTGQLFDVSAAQDGTDLRVVRTIYDSAFSLNNASQLSYRLGFADGSEGIFITTVPAPATLALMASAAPLSRRRR